jgi:hypothetical protein
MNRTTTRLALRLHRFELAILGGLALLGFALTFVVSGWLDATGFGPGCVAAMQTGADMTQACQHAQDAFYRTQDNWLVGFAAVLRTAVPFLLAALVGVGLVARDLERGTARLAWSLAPSRMVWFAGRLLPVLAIVVAVALLSGFAADRYLVASEPGMNPYASLLGFGDRGIDFAARVVFGFACAVLIGALTGRTLPALLLSVIVVYVGLAGGSSVHGRILSTEAVPTANATYNPADLTYDSGFLAPDGRLISWDEMARIDKVNPNDPGDWTPSYPQGSLVVPGERYPFVVAREVAVLLGGALVAFGLAFLQVRRVRPG